MVVCATPVRPGPKARPQQVDIHDPAVARPRLGPGGQDRRPHAVERALHQDFARHPQIGAPPDVEIAFDPRKRQ